MNTLGVLESPLTYSGSIVDIEKMRREITRLARINRLPEANSMQTMELLKAAWDKVDVFTHAAFRFKVLAKLLYVALLIITLIVTTIITLGLNTQVGAQDEDLCSLATNSTRWYLPPETMDHIVMGCTLVATLVTSVVSFSQPATKWQTLRGAALALESEIWKFRTRSMEYVVDTTSTQQAQRGGSRSAERQLQAYVQQLTKHTLKSATVMDTSFLADLDGLFGAPKRRPTWFNHGQYPPKTKRQKQHEEEMRQKRADGGINDDHHSPCSPEDYLRLRVSKHLEFYQSRLLVYYRRRVSFEIAINLSTLASTLLAFLGYGSWAAIPAAIAAAVLSFSKFDGTEKKITRFSESIASLDAVLVWWRSLDVERTNITRISDLVSRCEETFQTERQSWISTSMASKMLGTGEDKDSAPAGAASGGGEGSQIGMNQRPGGGFTPLPPS